MFHQLYTWWRVLLNVASYVPSQIQYVRMAYLDKFNTHDTCGVLLFRNAQFDLVRARFNLQSWRPQVFFSFFFETGDLKLGLGLVIFWRLLLVSTSILVCRLQSSLPRISDQYWPVIPTTCCTMPLLICYLECLYSGIIFSLTRLWMLILRYYLNWMKNIITSYIRTSFPSSEENPCHFAYRFQVFVLQTSIRCSQSSQEISHAHLQPQHLQPTVSSRLPCDHHQPPLAIPIQYPWHPCTLPPPI